ncbi:MAG: cupin domain-containing protein, partial [Acidobacteria bacterium]|nr:cupin domain-containing protein [Acidobacteriota bacterium]
RGEKSPTLSILTRMARGLNLSLSALLGAEPARGGAAIVRRAAQMTYTDPKSGYERRQMSPAHTGVEILMHIIPPHATSGELPPYALPTQKHVIVDSGRLDITIGGDQHSLEAGDTISFEVATSYVLTNPAETPCVCYLVVVRSP